MRFPPPVPKSCGSNLIAKSRNILLLLGLSSSSLALYSLTLTSHRSLSLSLSLSLLSLSLSHSLMTSTSLLVSIHLPRRTPFDSKIYSYLPKYSLHSKSFVCFSSPINASNSDREEIRWLREEQRWLREEQRWLREEQRWLHEREILLREISNLKLQIQVMESRNSTKDGSVSDAIANMGSMLQVLKEKNLIAESGSISRPFDLGEKRDVEEQEKKVAVEENVRVSERWEEEGKKKKRNTLRMGSEGEEVRVMQVCSQ